MSFQVMKPLLEEHRVLVSESIRIHNVYLFYQREMETV